MRNKFPVAVHLFFISNNQILFLRRYNTGFEDGKYSVVAGHLESGETVTQAAIREAVEEVGVVLTNEDIQIVHVMNRKSEEERIDFFMVITHWSGEIVNREPTKCDNLKWFPIESLPSTIIPYVSHAIQCYEKRLYYSEFGW